MYSSPLPCFGTVHACLGTAASTPPADCAQECMNRARDRLFKWPGHRARARNSCVQSDQMKWILWSSAFGSVLGPLV